MVGLVGEDAELSHILAQPMGESVEHDGQEDDGENGKPDVMLVSLQRFREIIIIRQGTSDDDRVGREIGSHIEVILLQSLRLSLHTRSQSILQRLLYLLAVQVIGKTVIVLAHIVVHHLTVGPYQRDTQILAFMFTDESIQFGFRQELIDRVWPKDVLVLDRTVDVNITRMRKKIGKFAKCIVTRLGFGYYFDA